MAANEPGGAELSPNLPSNNFASLERQLIVLSNKNADPNSPEVKRIHHAREPLVRAARQTDAYHDLKTHFVHLQEEIKEDKDTFDGVMRRIHAFNTDGADLAILAETGNDNTRGFAEVYKGMTILRMQEAHAEATARHTKDPNWRKTADDLKRQIAIKGWDHEVYGSHEIDDIAKKTVEDRYVLEKPLETHEAKIEDDKLSEAIFGKLAAEEPPITVTLDTTSKIKRPTPSDMFPFDEDTTPGAQLKVDISEPDFLGNTTQARLRKPVIEPPLNDEDTRTGRTRPAIQLDDSFEEPDFLNILQPHQPKTAIEREVFGEDDAFTRRWTRSHGIKEQIQPAYGSGVTEPFSPVDILNEVLETGLTQQQQLIQVTEAFKSSKDRNFRIGALNGFIGLINTNQQMKTGRIEYVAEALKSLPPQAMAQWLTVDPETKYALSALFELSGYKVANSTQIDKSGVPPFSDFLNLRHDDVTEYLKRVQQTVGTDRGVVTLAYTIFRALGFPHENAKFAKDLVGKYQFDPKTGKGDIDAKDIAPFIDRFEDPTAKIRGKSPLPGKEKYYLRDVLEKEGIDQFIVSLNNLQAQQIAREWDDMKLILDGMDNLQDTRDGTGGAGLMSVQDRYNASLGIKELAIAMAKRKFSEETKKRIFDPKKISSARPEAKPSTLSEAQAYWGQDPIIRGIKGIFGGNKRNKK
jgi:hypothetical protein